MSTRTRYTHDAPRSTTRQRGPEQGPPLPELARARGGGLKNCGNRACGSACGSQEASHGLGSESRRKTQAHALDEEDEALELRRVAGRAFGACGAYGARGARVGGAGGAEVAHNVWVAEPPQHRHLMLDRPKQRTAHTSPATTSNTAPAPAPAPGSTLGSAPAPGAVHARQSDVRVDDLDGHELARGKVHAQPHLRGHKGTATRARPQGTRVTEPHAQRPARQASI